jgi:hypothetical protein
MPSENTEVQFQFSTRQSTSHVHSIASRIHIIPTAVFMVFMVKIFTVIKLFFLMYREVDPVLNYSSTTPWRHMGSGGIAPPFFTLALDGCEWSVLHPGRFILGESPWYPLDGRLGQPQSQSRPYGEKSCPCWDLNPGRPACSLLLYWLSYPDYLFFGVSS